MSFPSSVSFTYAPAITPGPLQQGEILANIYLHIADLPLTKLEEGIESEVILFHHPFLLVLNNDCDLRYDFLARFPDEESQADYVQAQQIAKANILLPFVTSCALYDGPGIRKAEGRNLNSDLWRRVVRNQDERYHRIGPAAIEASSSELPEFFLDFKKTIPLPTEHLYQGIATGGIERLAILPPPYLHDLVHRYFSFQSRVAVPDD